MKTSSLIHKGQDPENPRDPAPSFYIMQKGN